MQRRHCLDSMLRPIGLLSWKKPIAGLRLRMWRPMCMYLNEEGGGGNQVNCIFHLETWINDNMDMRQGTIVHLYCVDDRETMACLRAVCLVYVTRKPAISIGPLPIEPSAENTTPGTDTHPSGNVFSEGTFRAKYCGRNPGGTLGKAGQGWPDW